MGRLGDRGGLVAGVARLLAIGLLGMSVVAPARAHAFAAPPQTSQPPLADAPGADIFKARCAACHEGGIGHAPPVSILRMMLPSAIRQVLTTGPMAAQAQGLSDADKTLVAEYLTGGKITDVDARLAPPRCVGRAAAFDVGEPPAFDGWGLSRGNGRSIPAQTAGLTAKDLPGLRLKWAIGFPGAVQVRSHPMLAGGAIYVGSNDGTVYALDRATGCQRWAFRAVAEVRTGIVVSPWKAGDKHARPLIYFGDLVGNVYALDARTGAPVWRDHADAHPSTTITGAPALSHGKLYVAVSSLEEANIDPAYPCCTFRGSVIAYEARGGDRLWQSYTGPPPVAQGRNAAGGARFGPSGAAIWSSPTIDEARGQLYVATGDNYSSPTTGMSDAIIAMDLATGKVRWVHQALGKDAWNGGCTAKDRTLCPDEDGPDYDFGAPPILAALGGGHDILLAGQKSGDVYGIDPDSGRLVWRNKVGRGGILAGVYFGMAVSGRTLVTPVTDAPDARHYDESARPGLYGLDLRTGKTLWAAPDAGKTCNGRPFCVPGIASAITATPTLVLTGASDGWLRVYDVTTGKVLWTYDTTRKVTTVGGGQAAGGSIGGGVAPIAYHGTVIVPSGYGFAGKMPGNVMLVFGPGPAAKPSPGRSR